VTDNSKVVLQLASGGADPRSSNQTLTNTGSRKEIGIDLAYGEYTFMPAASRRSQDQEPGVAPGAEHVLDGDFNPEGGSVTYDRACCSASAYGWWLTEQFNSNPPERKFRRQRLRRAGGPQVPAARRRDPRSGQLLRLRRLPGQLAAVPKSAFGNTTLHAWAPAPPTC